MDRKPKPSYHIEPMPRKQFLSLMKSFKSSGGIYLANDESEIYLEAKGAEAVTLNAKTILFRKRPSRSAVYEELFHVEQYREGKIDGSLCNKYICEIEAKKYLLENAENFQLTEAEITQTKISLKWYETKLKELEREG